MAHNYKTPTPTVFNAGLVVNSTLIEGTLTSTDEDGNITPEVGAYIYIYVNNILINEDNRIIIEGEERAGVSTIVQDTSESPDLPLGYWSFTCKALAYGSYVTVRAQSPSKLMSDFSITYRVGGCPIPVDIVSLKSDGLFGPPVAGDTTIEGEFSGLKNYLYNATEEYFYPYLKNIDIYTYIDGIKQKALPYNQIIGRNFISDFTFIDNNFDIDLLVQGEPVNITMDNFSQTIFEEAITGVEVDMIPYHPPTDSAFLMNVYCNGLRLAQNTNTLAYDYYLSHSPSGDPVVVLNQGFAPLTTDLFYLQYIGLAEVDTSNYASLIFQGTTDEDYIIPYTSNYQVYKNGLRMLEGVTYDFTAVSDQLAGTTTIIFNRQDGNNIILVTDTIIIDYRLGETVDPFYGLRTQSPNYVTPSIVDAYVNGVAKKYFYLDINKGSFDHPTYLAIYKNGIKQRPSSNSTSTDGDYTLEKTSTGYRASFFVTDIEPFVYTFSLVEGVRVYTVSDNFVVDFVYSDAAVESSLDRLNTLPAMIDNKITASYLIDPINDMPYLIFESPYTLEFPPDSTKYQTFFGKYPSLNPGKTPEGHFKCFIDFRRNRWRYTFDRPLKKRMHITASAFPRS